MVLIYERLPEKEEETKPPMVPTVIFDIEAAKAKVNEYLEEVDNMVALAKDLAINNEKDHEDATALGTKAMSTYKKIVEAKENVRNYKEAKEYVEKVDLFTQILTEKLYSTKKNAGDTVVSITKQKISQWTIVQEQERRKAEQLAKEQTDKLNEQLRKEAEKTGTKPVEAVAPIIPQGQKTVRTETGSSHARHIWTFELKDPGLPRKAVEDLVARSLGVTPKDREGLPEAAKEVRDFLPYIVIVFEDTRLRKAVKDGVRNPAIKGVDIYEKTETTFRTR